jgi:N-acetylglucosaminyl-diphospho-decaprenol L-rhamnosyltransferase
MSAPDLSIIIVNYNGKQDLPRCLAALTAVQSELMFEVIVVDNGSTDGSLDDAATSFPAFHYIPVGHNLGFAAGCNRGLVEAQGRHAMLLNPDTEVLPGALSALVHTLDENPRWGIVGPRMLDANDQPYPAARRFPTPWRLFCESTRLMFLVPHWRLFADYYYGESDPRTVDRVDQVEGSALVISGAARKEVGNLDERFFLFFEEVDWCRRVTAAGYEIHVVQAAAVRHHLSTTMSRFYLTSREAHARSAMAYFHKHEGDAGLARLRRWMRSALFVRECGMGIATLLGGERARLRAEGARVERALYRRGPAA